MITIMLVDDFQVVRCGPRALLETEMEALRADALGCVLKDASSDEVIQAVREVANGGRYLRAPLKEQPSKSYY